jgi:hypothetical protein
MKIQGRHVGGLTMLLALGVMLGPGCAENKSSIFIRGAMVVPSDTCTVTADSSAALQFRGTFDAGFAAEYSAVLLVGNQLVRRGNAATLRTETSRVVLNGADVRIANAAGDTIGEFSVPVSGFVDPGSGTEPGYGAASVVVVDAATGDAVAPNDGSRRSVEVVASVILHGETLGGVEIDSGEWQFPIDVCKGCLVFFPGDADIPGDAGVDCNNRDDAPTTVCRVGMDAPIDCRLCSGTNPLCTP